MPSTGSETTKITKLMQKPYAMTLLFTFSRTGRRTESVLTHISRAKHDWRVSGMFPGPPGGVAAQRATGDAAQDSGSLSQKVWKGQYKRPGGGLWGGGGYPMRSIDIDIKAGF